MKRRPQNEKENLELLRKLRPMDDDFFRCLFRDNIPLAEFVLRIITHKKDLVITDCQVQKDLKRLAGARSLCLDAYGTDSTGKKYDLEIQRAESGAVPRRARYHSSVMDVENLNTGQKFEELPETYIIFITEEDFYKQGEPIYPIERVNLITGEEFQDGTHILYVNGEYRGDTELGRLMHDFNCTDAGDMKFDLLAERTRYLKENQEGVKAMCKLLEEMRDESRKSGIAEGKKIGRKAGLTDVALRMIEDGTYSLEQIVKISGLSSDKVKELSLRISSRKV